MSDYIRLQKNHTDEEFTELQVSAGNSVISATAKIYVTSSMLEDLQDQILVFLQEQDLEAYWENDVPGIGGPPCVTIKLLPAVKSDTVLAEIYMELNDGGSFMDHHCRFYVCTSRPALQAFAEALSHFSSEPAGSQIELQN